MSDWKCYGDERPRAGRDLWIKPRGNRKPKGGRICPKSSEFPDMWWLWSDECITCRYEDLWCYAEPPPLPKRGKRDA